MSSPQVTIAIVFLNAMPHFPLAVRSCLGQTFTDFELILIDDGSSDGSLEFARTVAESDSRIRVLADGRNLKLNMRLNQAIDLARGKFFARMDADDVMMPWRLEHQVAVQSLQGPCFLGGAAISIDAENRIRGLRRARRNPRTLWQARHMFIHPTVFAPTELFRANKYNESFLFHRSQDAELWVRLWRKVKCVSDSKPVIFYRENDIISIDNYLGTAFGVSAIGLRLPNASRLCKLIWIAREFLKTWLVCALVLFNRTSLLVKARSMSLAEAEVVRYEGLLRDIGETAS